MINVYEVSTDRMPEELLHRQIEAMGEIEAMSKGLGIRAYQWGGWAADLLTREATRQHYDLDYLCIVDDSTTLLQLDATLAKHGWSTKNEKGALIADRRGVESGFIPVTREGDTIRWAPTDRPGIIVFPGDWLPNETIPFQGITTRAADIRLSYALKILPYRYNPNLKSREKDTHDIERMERILSGFAKTDPAYNPEIFLEQMSLTPSVVGGN